MEFEFLVGGVRRKLSLEGRGAFFKVRDGEVTFEAEIRRVSDAEILIRSGGRSRTVYLARDGRRRLAAVAGRSIEISEPGADADLRVRGAEGGLGDAGTVKAPMPGKVVKIHVAEGQAVRLNQSLIVVEAMKMENDIRAAAAGTVKKIHVATGDLVDAERTLIELELKNPEPSAGTT